MMPADWSELPVLVRMADLRREAEEHRRAVGNRSEVRASGRWRGGWAGWRRRLDLARVAYIRLRNRPLRASPLRQEGDPL